MHTLPSLSVQIVDAHAREETNCVAHAQILIPLGLDTAKRYTQFDFFSR